MLVDLPESTSLYIMSYELIKNIPQQPLAIIGDIHGEYTALENLLIQLKNNSKDRRIVFIGDLCDRGPKSVSVIKKVISLIHSKKAYVILGNHEINLIANDAKDGSGWFFDSRTKSDNQYYAPYERANHAEKQLIKDFFNTLPIAISMPGLNLVHAAWDQNSIDRLIKYTGKHTCFTDVYNYWHDYVLNKANENNLKELYFKQKELWAKQLEDPKSAPPFLEYIAQFESLEQNFNPIKRITSGIEKPCEKPFFSGNRWRFSDRTTWWDEYSDSTAVIIGHYWRLFTSPKPGENWRYSQLFKNISPFAWHGMHKQVFCIDYSVGARWRERKQNIQISDSKFKLAAMLWPEKELIFDDGSTITTQKS